MGTGENDRGLLRRRKLRREPSRGAANQGRTANRKRRLGFARRLGRMAPTQVISALLRFALAAVFIYAGAVKILDAQRFALDVQHYDLTPWTVSVLVAVYLPWLEVTAGVALMVRRQQLG